MKKSLFALFGILLFMSCNIHVEKRLYRKGYYVEVTANRKNHSAGRKNNELNRPEMELSHMLADENAYNQNISIPTENTFYSPIVMPDDLTLVSANQDRDKLNVYHAPIEVNTVIHKKLESNVHARDFSSATEVESGSGPTQNTNGDANLYLLAALMAAVVFGVFKLSQRLSLTISRWASRNKTTTKVLMTLMHVKIGVMGVLTGKELFEMGYTFSNSMEYIFGGIMVVPFLYLLLNKSKDEVMVLRSFYLRKLSILGLVLPFYMLTVGIGNKLADHRAQISPLGFIVEKTHDAFAEKRGTTFAEKHVPVSKENATHPTEVNKKASEDSRDGCDVITMTDNTTMEVLIQSVNGKEVRYKKCNNPNGPTFVTSANKVSKIVKSNGEIIEPNKLTDSNNSKSTGWPGWYIAVYIIMTLLLVCAMIMAWLFLYYTPAAPIAITVVCLALIIGVPLLMNRRVKLGNIKRKEKKNNK